MRAGLRSASSLLAAQCFGGEYYAAVDYERDSARSSDAAYEYRTLDMCLGTQRPTTPPRPFGQG